MPTEFPVLENVEDKEYYGRAATEIKNVVDIKYNKQQPLIAFCMNISTGTDHKFTGFYQKTVWKEDAGLAL